MKKDTRYILMEEKNGILLARYKNIFIDISVSEEVLEVRKEFTKNKSLPMLLNCLDVKGIDKESRDFFALPKCSEGLTATALIIGSKLQVFIANFLLKVNWNKTKLPIKLFNNEAEALTWLEKHK